MPTNNIIFFFVAGIAALVVLFFAFFSVFSIYVLVRYGKSRTFSLTLSTIYGVVFVGLVLTTITKLQQLL